MEAWQWVDLLSPTFVTLLLINGSGIPQLEKKADQEQGGQSGFQAYKTRIPVLLPEVR
ncbi:UNVERIFIED_CONTAM: DUF1295 domain-containing protein [Actinomycetes bacterium ARC8]|nr:DUF1295 domain-containing protein [Actinomycetes bacterium ARC8]